MERSIKGVGSTDQLVPWVGKFWVPVEAGIWC